MRHDPKNPNAWWVRREDIEEVWRNYLWPKNPKMTRSRKWIFWTVMISYLLIVVYLTWHWLWAYS
jgi:hypothetical protein